MMVTTGGSSPWAPGEAPDAALLIWGKNEHQMKKPNNIRKKNRIKEQVGIRVIKDLLWNSARKYSPHSFIKLEKLFFWRGVKPPAVNDHGTAQNQNLSIRMDGIGFIIIVEPT